MLQYFRRSVPPQRCRGPLPSMSDRAVKISSSCWEKLTCLNCWKAYSSFNLAWKTIVGGSCHNYHFCRDKHVLVGTKHVFCRDKSMLVATNVILSRQRVCRGKPTTVVATKDVFCRDKHVYVATKLSSRQKLYLWQPSRLVIEN